MRDTRSLVASLALALLASPAGAVTVPPAGARPVLTDAAFEGPDASRTRVPVRLELVAGDAPQPTDIQPWPGRPGTLIVLGKQGTAWWVDLAAGQGGVWLKVDVLTRSEQGLLGLAFHPDFARNGRFYLHTSVESKGERVGRVAEWTSTPGAAPAASAPKAGRTLIEVEQPYVNHDGGQIAFGADGKLYVAFGDGGAANDPHGHGQDRGTLLGAILRLEVEGSVRVPKDNPFVGQKGVRPEIWAYGLRNPWRFHLLPDGRAIVGDVGQNKWEEITVVRAGENHGWNRREGDQCFPPGTTCDTKGLVDPIHVYGHDVGNSVTGGYLYQGADVPDLKGLYVFGDYGSGRLWAIPLPPAGAAVKASDVRALGRWPVAPSTFGLGHDGALYVGDFGGRVFRVRAGR
jgi:glucose/arabinose dehydrogenase